MIYLIFSLFILYTVLCCLDGPDLKPKGQNWLGHKLHSYANKYVSYNTPLELTLPTYEIPIYETRYVPLKIKSYIRVSEIAEMELFGYLKEKDRYLELVKKNCIEGLLDQIREHQDELITIEEIRNPYDGTIDIRGEIQVCTKKENYRCYSNIDYSEVFNNFGDLRHDRQYRF